MEGFLEEEGEFDIADLFLDSGRLVDSHGGEGRACGELFGESSSAIVAEGANENEV